MRERLEVFAGSMFSGKTDEVLREIRKAEVAEKVIQAFKTNVDTRTKNKIRSHSGAEYPATEVDSSRGILTSLIPGVQLVVIDEAQFFDKEIVDVVEVLLESGIQVIANGLPTDFRGEPFGPMPTLLAKADQIARLQAICTYKDGDGKVCGDDASRTQRFVDGVPASYHEPIIVIGEKEQYAPRCPKHHEVPGKKY
jgi:thymidine kinase